MSSNKTSSLGSAVHLWEGIAYGGIGLRYNFSDMVIDSLSKGSSQSQ